MTVIENMLGQKKHAPVLFYFFIWALFSTSASLHSDLCSCRFLTSIHLKSSGKDYLELFPSLQSADGIESVNVGQRMGFSLPQRDVI